MIEKDWRISQDKKNGNLCIYYKNPITKEWDEYLKLERPKYKNGVLKMPKKSKKEKRCVVM